LISNECVLNESTIVLGMMQPCFMNFNVVSMNEEYWV